MENKLTKYIDSISNNFDNKVNDILAINYHHDINSFMSGTDDLSNEELDSILEALINDYLKKIKNLLKNIDQLDEISKKVDEVAEFFEEKDDNDVSFEGDNVASDLILKVVGNKNRKLELPIKISFIKNYCINNRIDDEDIKTTLLWVILKLASVTIAYKITNKFI